MKGSCTLILLVLFFLAPTLAEAHTMASNRSFITHIDTELEIDDLESPAWDKAAEVPVGSYWSGAKAPENRHFAARLLWSDTALYVRFEGNQTEPLNVSNSPDLTKKTIGLWDRDVCEIFIAPDRKARNKYFEFEIAPTGEWIDLGIVVTSKRRITDLEYNSGMKSAAVIKPDKVLMAIKVEWKALGKTPKAGDVWLGNLFRCIGKDPTRGYLSWQATKTKQPNFHVPAKFGEFHFVDK